MCLEGARVLNRCLNARLDRECLKGLDVLYACARLVVLGWLCNHVIVRPRIIRQYIHGQRQMHKVCVCPRSL